MMSGSLVLKNQQRKLIPCSRTSIPLLSRFDLISRDPHTKYPHHPIRLPLVPLSSPLSPRFPLFHLPHSVTREKTHLLPQGAINFPAEEKCLQRSPGYILIRTLLLSHSVCLLIASPVVRIPNPDQDHVSVTVSSPAAVFFLLSSIMPSLLLVIVCLCGAGGHNFVLLSRAVSLSILSVESAANRTRIHFLLMHEIFFESAVVCLCVCL